jgi:membrane protein DedA with SNARE-associated domain
MNSLDTLATFLGWCTLINVGLIIFIVIVVGFFHDGIGYLMGRMFGVDERQAKIALLRIFMHYRVLVLVLNLFPTSRLE